MSRKSRKNEAFDLPSFQMIRAASNGDIEAINAVLKHYEGYIAALSTRKMYDENRQVHYCVDETLRRRLVFHCILVYAKNAVQLLLRKLRKQHFMFLPISNMPIIISSFAFQRQFAYPVKLIPNRQFIIGRRFPHKSSPPSPSTSTWMKFLSPFHP